MAYFQVFPRLCFKARLSAKLLIITTTTIIIMIKLFYILFAYFLYLFIYIYFFISYIYFLSLDIKLHMALRKKKQKQKQNKTKINQKSMIHRREFKNKLTKELLKIVHYNLQTSVRLSLFSKDVTVDFQFLKKTVPQTCSTDWNRDI